MPKFKHPVTGNVFEVDEERAVQVLRPQNFYIEVMDSDVSSASESGSKEAPRGRGRVRKSE